MAPAMAISDPRAGNLGLRFPFGTKMSPEEKLRRRNEDLEREAREGREREAALRRDLEMKAAMLRAAEEAEERLCAQLGDLEAEAADQARDYHRRIQELSDQLARAHRIINSSSSPSLL